MNTPPDASGFTRRQAVKLAVVGLAGAAVGIGSTPLLHKLRAAPRPYRFFTDDEALLLTGICAQIIPADDTPGAAQTGAVNFIDRQLGGRYRRQRETYRRGLESFRLTCAQVHGQAFHELARGKQIELLQAVEANHVPQELWSQPSAPAFFSVVVAHTMQGFYGSPRHGGNRDHASFRMLGIDYPAIAGQNRYPQA